MINFDFTNYFKLNSKSETITYHTTDKKIIDYVQNTKKPKLENLLIDSDQGKFKITYDPKLSKDQTIVLSITKLSKQKEKITPVVVAHEIKPETKEAETETENKTLFDDIDLNKNNNG